MLQHKEQIKKIHKQYLKIVHHLLIGISKINNTQVDNAKDLDVEIPMHNLIEYSNNHTKTSRSLSQYQKEDNILDSQ